MMESLSSIAKQKYMKVEYETDLKKIKSALKSYPDFPKKGVLFWDIFSILQDHKLTKCLFNCLEYKIRNQVLEFDAIVGLDSRGFLFGTHLAMIFEKPFMPIRKKGKLPGNVISQSYSLEYGSDEVEIQNDGTLDGKKVLIIDDLLATGGTLLAANKLMEKINASVVLNIVIIEITALNGKTRLDTPFIALFSMHD